MKILMCLIYLIVITSCNSTNQTLKTDNIQAKATHKTIAILPPVVQIKVNEMEIAKISPAIIEDAEMKLTFMIQNEFYKQMQKNKYSVTIEPLLTTNNKIFASGLSFSKYKTMSEIQLMELLGVDAVVFTNTSLSKINYKSVNLFLNVGSVGGFILSAIATGTESKNAQTDDIMLSVKIIDSKNTLQIWQKSYTTQPSSYSTLDNFFIKSLKNAGKEIPYKK